MENNSLPIYKTRKFWATTILTIFIGWISYLAFLNQLSISELILAALGTTMYELIGFSLASKSGAYFAIALYAMVQGFLLHKAFGSKIVKIQYPVISISLFMVGVIGLFLYAGSF